MVQRGQRRRRSKSPARAPDAILVLAGGPRMVPIHVDSDRCKGCGLCIEFCPQHCLRLSDHLNPIGYHPVELSDAAACNACTLCAIMCPDTGLSVFRSGTARKKSASAATVTAVAETGSKVAQSDARGDATTNAPLSQPPRTPLRRRLVQGNEALALGALAGGCEAFFGYPITPQNEIPEILSALMPPLGRIFVQAESELASINMVYGGAAAGHRVMTSSSSPGISLMMEGLSYIAGARLPCVLINVMRGGPGLGNIAPSQSDYFQAVKGGGHGDYRCIVLAPWNVQEMFDFPALAFELADRYRMPAFILTDAVIGTMLEPASVADEFPPPPRPSKPWATCGRNGRAWKNVANSLYLQPEELCAHCEALEETYREVERREVRFNARYVEDADYLVVAFGVAARLALTAVRQLRRDGIRAGLLRPVTLWPFPTAAVATHAQRARAVLVVELNGGQMVEDVRLAVNGRRPVAFFGKMGGVLPPPEDVAEVVRRMAQTREVAHVRH
jgi:2-oxoglutarate ferredoxin oxidoreductase subunit alpha